MKGEIKCFKKKIFEKEKWSSITKINILVTDDRTVHGGNSIKPKKKRCLKRLGTVYLYLECLNKIYWYLRCLSIAYW